MSPEKTNKPSMMEEAMSNVSHERMAAVASYLLKTGICTPDDWVKFVEDRVASEKAFVLEGNHFWITLNKLIYNKTCGHKNKINSLIAFLVGVTTALPDFSLPFSPRKDIVLMRFSNPDIDCDFEDNGEIMAYLRRKFGETHVGNIGTYGSMKVKAAFQNAVKAKNQNGHSLHLMRDFVIPTYNRLKQEGEDNHIPKAWFGLVRDYQDAGDLMEGNSSDSAKLITKVLDLTAPDGGDTSNLGWSELVDDKYINDLMREKYPEIFKMAKIAVGCLVHSGVHAAGIVVVDKHIDSLIPMHWAKGKDKTPIKVTQWDMNDLESLGFLKFDVLCVKGLESLHKSVDLMVDRFRKIPGLENFKYNPYVNMKKDDFWRPKIVKLFKDKNTSGIFQFDGSGMTSFISDLDPTRFEDLVASTALFRPGPIKNNFHKLFIENKKGQNEWRSSIPNEELLKLVEPTYGMFVYQEQIMNACKILAGFTAVEADEVRKAVSKKDKDKINALRIKFVNKAKKLGKITEAQAESYWDKFEKFGSYCFNAAHSVSYTYLTWRLAYMKAIAPTEFFCGILSTELKHGNAQKKEDNMIRYMNEAEKEFGISFHSPNINLSQAFDFIPLPLSDNPSHESKQILKPIAVFPSIGENVANKICNRPEPYTSEFDFIKRNDIGVSVFEILVNGGLFDHWTNDRSGLMADFQKIKSDLSKKKNAPLIPLNIPKLIFN